MKAKIIILTLTSLLCVGTSIGRDNNSIPKIKDLTLQESHGLSDDEIKQPKTKKRAIAGIKVLNRHDAKFSYNTTDISYREAIKLVRKKFDTLIIIENQKTESVTITDKK